MLLFVFDMDDVLYGYDWKVRMEGMTALTGLSLEQMRERWWNERGEQTAEAGAFDTAEDHLRAVSESLGVPVSAEDWLRIRGGAMTPWLESIAAVKRASELGTVTLLTNNGPMTGEHLATLAPELVPIFGDHLFASSHYGARKPDPAVFMSVLERYDARAEDTFFADDLAVNVAGAAGVGISAHLFTTADGLLAAIEEFAASRAAVK